MSVRTLRISACPFLTDRDLEPLRAMAELSRLDLDNTRMLTDLTLENLASHPKLSELYLMGIPQITDRNFIPPKTLPVDELIDEVKILKVADRGNFTENSAGHKLGIPALHRLVNLHTLFIKKCEGISVTGVSYLVENHPNQKLTVNFDGTIFTHHSNTINAFTTPLTAAGIF